MNGNTAFNLLEAYTCRYAHVVSKKLVASLICPPPVLRIVERRRALQREKGKIPVSKLVDLFPKGKFIGKRFGNARKRRRNLIMWPLDAKASAGTSPPLAF